MIYNIEFDICALILTSILLICFCRKKHVPTLQNKIFCALIILVVSATMINIIDSVVISYAHTLPHWLYSVIPYFYHSSMIAIVVLFSFYVVSLTNTHNNFFHSFAGMTFAVPLVAVILLLIANPFFSHLFYYDNAIQYHRGSLFFTLYIVLGFYLVYGVIYTYCHRELLTKEKRSALYIFAGISILSLILQFMYPKTQTTMLSMGFALLILFFTIQNPEEILNGSTGLFNYSAFLTTVGMQLHTKMRFTVVSARINNYEYIKRMIGAECMSVILETIANNLKLLPVRSCTVYYIKDGHFLCTIPRKYMTSSTGQHIKDILDVCLCGTRSNIQVKSYVYVIECPEHANTIDGILEYVDFTDKLFDYDDTVMYASHMTESRGSRVAQVERAIERALANDTFEVYYQGIYSTKDGCIRSAEALLRLRDKELGFISPAEFIPIAEVNGTILRIGRLVFRRVCEFISSNDLMDKGIDSIEINLSVAECMQKELPDELIGILNEYNLPPHCINLEITETAVAHSPQRLSESMRTLSLSGVKFALDDYGTGYSAMSCMLELPFDMIKIDKSIVSPMNNKQARIIMSNTIKMLKQLQKKIVAEGVETAEQAEILISLGCDYLQGFYFLQPVPQERFLELLYTQFEHCAWSIPNQ